MNKDDGVLLSIIVPVYNVENYLVQCIESVLGQNFDDYELILVDDGSIDNSSVICDEYEKNEHITVIHKKNGGLSDARNVGLGIAKGKYVIFLDSDDYWEDNEFLYKLSLKIIENNFDVGIIGYKKLYHDCSKKEVLPLKKTSCYFENIKDAVNLGAYNICAWDKVVKRSVIFDNNLVFEKDTLSEDMEWCANILIYANDCFVLNETPYIYRQRKGSISQTITTHNIECLVHNFDKCKELKKLCSGIKEKAYLCYLSKNISMIIITISFLPVEKQKMYDYFVRDNYRLLKLGKTKRERIIYAVIRTIGIRKTEKLLSKMYKKIHQV